MARVVNAFGQSLAGDTAGYAPLPHPNSRSFRGFPSLVVPPPLPSNTAKLQNSEALSSDASSTVRARCAYSAAMIGGEIRDQRKPRRRSSSGRSILSVGSVGLSAQGRRRSMPIELRTVHAILWSRPAVLLIFAPVAGPTKVQVGACWVGAVIPSADNAPPGWEGSRSVQILWRAK
ncbi:hypothetical protein DAEQUDRAFT_306976 [Daedalea quercina L-15889]|uniref:Uncharacterized protein n=1 Tax=Daedalea quercina L-15889 TaxID=1314783 RepID=A0A165Q2S4_9APHY|nr:hypothetical protein DAEQUDRAFT_306976 [Daedalea quercina L-15889]